jgi:hypothetical protein
VAKAAWAAAQEQQRRLEEEVGALEGGTGCQQGVLQTAVMGGEAQCYAGGCGNATGAAEYLGCSHVASLLVVTLIRALDACRVL